MHPPVEPVVPVEPVGRDGQDGQPVEPNSGRIVDHWLGGCHHFAVDVATARSFDAVYPQFPRVFRVLRQYTARVTRFIRSRGVEQFLVLGAGIPTQGNVHELVPDARVLYTDIDPLNVTLGRAILRGLPTVDYVLMDARDPGALLSPAPAADMGARLLDPGQRTGIVAIGLLTFLGDAELARLFAALHAWAAPDSLLAFDFDSDIVLQYPALRDLVLDGFHYRTPPQVLPLLGPWHLSEEGICPVAGWGGCTDDADLPVFMYGGVARRDATLP